MIWVEVERQVVNSPKCMTATKTTAKLKRARGKKHTSKGEEEAITHIVSFGLKNLVGSLFAPCREVGYQKVPDLQNR